MDDMNHNENVDSLEINKTTSETASNGDRDLIREAKDRMFGAQKKDQPKQNVIEPKSEEVVHDDIDDDLSINKEKIDNSSNDEKRDRVREKDKKSISRLTAQKHALKEENARLQAEIQKYKEKVSKEPIPEDYENESAYNRAKIKHELEIDAGSERIQLAEKELIEKKNIEWTERCQSTTKNFEKFAENYSKYHGWLTENEPELMSFASQSVVGPKLLEEAFDDLFQNPEAYNLWQSTSRSGKINLLANMENHYINNFNKPVQNQKSAAPSPIAPEKGSEKIASKAISDEEQIRRAKQRMFGK